ncbi:hypothetical protein ACOMHN_056228 [Nucella lapillus]
MEKHKSPLNSSQDMTLAAYGMEQKVDDKTIFCTPDPMAASTITRETNRMRIPTTTDSKGSFLDDWSRLSIQPVSDMELTQQLNQLNFTLTSNAAPQELGGAAAADSGPDLIQFSGNTEADNSDQETNKSGSLTNSSSRSSMGLIPSDMLSDCDLLQSASGFELSASVLPLSNTKTEPHEEEKPREASSSHSTLKEKTADSKDWSDSSKQDSKQDSKDIPWGRSQLETVKKRPQASNVLREGEPAASLPCSLFAGVPLDDVVEGEELDQSVHNVELGEEDLRQLDAGINFSDLEEDHLSGRESGDEDFDFDEPMLSLPNRGRVERGAEEGADSSEEKTLQAELAEAGCRLGEGRESEEDGASAQSAASGLGLDSGYFRKTSMPFAGDGEDSEVAISRGSLTASSQQRGAAEGEHLLTKLRRQFMSGDGSENEIDTEDELEAARKSLSLASRERGQGADEEDTDRSNLPLPVGLEDDKSSNSGIRGNTRGEDQAPRFSYLTRQRAEGDVSRSCPPWQGGGEGDGSSGGDSDGGGGKIAASTSRPPFRYVSGAAVGRDQPIQSSSRAATVDRSGLQAEFFLPTSPNDSEVTSPPNLEGSTFHVEDILRSSAGFPTDTQNKQADAARVEGFDFGARTIPDNPFEDQFASSFGSFGLGPEDEETAASPSYGRPTKKGSEQEMTRDTVGQTPSPEAELSANTVPSEPPPKGSGSFDGPFRKPRVPGPPKNKTERMEAEVNLERQLRELGIYVGDDDFHTAEGAKIMLEAEEKEFLEENKFSQHHQLALAAEGLAWDGEEGGFSGFLGGEEQAEHLETSIGTYMATRTETLGTLGGDPSIPRPEFGRPVSSPTNRLFPRKIMSPPSTCSSIVTSRTEGEGDEESDSSMQASSLTSPSRPGDAPPTLGEQLSVVADPAADDKAAAEETLREELSSIMLDITQGGGDITMEEIMSKSSMLDFFRNHSYSNAIDFVTAIVKASNGKTQRGKDSTAREQTAVDGVHAKKGMRKSADQGSGDSEERREGLTGTAASVGQSKPSASGSPRSPHQRASRLPVRVGATPALGSAGSAAVKKTDENRGETVKAGSSMTQDSSSSRKSQSGKRSDVTSVRRGESMQGVSRQNVGETKREISGQREDKSRSRSGPTPSLATPGPQDKSSSLSSSETLSANQQRQQFPRTNTADKKTSHVRFEDDHADSFHSPKFSTDHRIPSKESPRREKDSGQKQEKVEHKQNWSDSKTMESLNAKSSVQPQTMPLDIPTDGNTEKESKTVKVKDQPLSQAVEKNSMAHTGQEKREEEEKWKDCGNFTHQYMSQFFQKLVANNQPHSSTSSSWPQESAKSQTSLLGQSLQLTGGVMMGSFIDSGLQAKTTESRPFPITSTAGSYQPPIPSVSQEIAQRLGTLPQSVPSSEGRRQQPTLLTGSSLLRTEFAQKFLTPAMRGQTGTGSTHVPPDYLPPEDSCLPTPSIHPASSQVYSGSHPTPHPMAHQSFANSTAQGVDVSTMSGYYELNEDPAEHSTMLGIECSGLASFWGKSPLYQSTPALGMGKQAAVSMVESRLDERELNTSGTNMVTPKVQRQLIQIQRAVDFQEFCYLGVSQKTLLPVTNRTVHVVICRFRLVRLLHNGNLVKLDQQSPFELRSKISIAAGASENVPVLFVPKQLGEHVCQIEVLAQSLNPTLAPTVYVIQLRAVAELPDIQTSPAVEVLNVGEVTWGSCVTRTLKLRNTKKASLPVRLSIWSGSSVWHCFTFDSCDTSSDLSIISMTSRPDSLGRNVVTVILPGCDSPGAAQTVELILFCRPPKKELSRALSERPAEQIDAKIDIEVDTPVKCLPPLQSIFLRATVGMPRLLIPTNQMSLTFRTKAHKSMQEDITINNSGNITLTLALSIATFSECFKISASRLDIRPGDREQVAVVFSPQDGSIYQFQSLLQLDVEPEGPSYEIPLEGQITRVEGTQQRAALSILTSKSYLAFHGVSLNQTRSLSMRLYNKDRNNAEHACVEVRQSTDSVKLVSSTGEWQQKCDVLIQPRETITLTAIFCPTDVQGYSGKLVIRKPDSRSSKYSIRLSGYGGRSALALSGACLTNSGQRWLEMGPLSLSRNIMKEIVLTNSGVRAAFVKASAFYDMPCGQPVMPGRVAVEPNNFVLAPGCSMKVMVAMSPSQREVDLVRSRKEVVAVVRFQHGDEVMRQKYQRACSREGGVDTHSWQAAFRQPFANEAQDSIIVEGSSIPDSPDDSSAFFHQLESVCMALLAQPAPGQQSTSLSVSSVLQQTPAATQAVSTPSSIPTHDRTYPHLREDSRQLESTTHFLVPGRPDEDGDWDIKPDCLSLTVGENNQKMLQLINFSKQPLSFQLSWPPNSVVPEPQKGELKPRSRTSIEVWLHMAWQQRLSELPWRGAIKVTCNGRDKSVRVMVQKPVVAQSPQLSLTPSPAPAPHPSTPPPDTPGHGLRLAATNVHFAKAKVNKLHERVLELTNESMEPVQMKLSPFAPGYVKGADETNTVKRVTYSVFTFPSTTADLLPQETLKLPVKFCPQSKGTFNQHWEIEYWSLAGGKKAAQGKKNTRFSLTAEVSDQEALSKKLSWDPVGQDKTGVTSTRAPLQEKHPNTGDSGARDDRGVPAAVPELQLLQPEVTFSNSRVGRLAQTRVEFKNSLDHNVQLEVDPPSAPFRIKHKSFKITKKRVLKYPIEFNPSSAGSFADTMVFRAPELGKTFTLYLKGTAM